MLKVRRACSDCSQVASSSQPPAKKASKPATTAATRRPQCTHVSMSRTYGSQTCQLCGKIPSIGWVYACKQDHELGHVGGMTDPDTFPVVPNESSYFDVQAQLAESLGMGASVTQGIRNGDYSFEQVDKLIEQKKHLLAMIHRAESGSADSTPQLRVGATVPSRFGESIIATAGTTAAYSSLPMTPAGTPSNSPAVSTANTPDKVITKGKQQTCNFQVCHGCRPFFQDRLYLSFENMRSGRMSAVTEEEITRLRFLDPAVVRTLGLRKQQPPSPHMAQSPESADIAMQQADGYEDDTSDWTPTSATNSEADLEQLEMADRYPCPGAGVCPLWSQFSGCAYDGDFDDGFRALNHGFGPEPDLSRITPENSLSRLRRVRGSVSDTPGGTSSSASSISLPTPSTVPLAPPTPLTESFDEAFTRRLAKSNKAASMLDILPSEKRQPSRRGLGIRSKNSTSSFGSEVEVEGGVALTEEAVGTGSPDIATDD